MSILADSGIAEGLGYGGLVIDPAPADGQLQPASVDLCLGRQFRVLDNHAHTVIDPLDPPAFREVDGRDGFVLHPGEFALAHTIETVGLPRVLVAQVNGKSSLGRLGLVVHATAGFIDPGFRGQITLELSNVATLPIRLIPGMRICQLVFFRLEAPARRPYGSTGLGSRYQHQSGAAQSKGVAA